MFRLSFVWALVAVCLLTFGSIGCGQKATDYLTSKAAEKVLAQDGVNADVKIDSKTGAVSIKTKDGDEDVSLEMDGSGNMTVTSQDGEKLNIQVDGDKMTMKTKEGDTTATYSADGETYTMTTEDGGPSVTIGKGAKVPEGFPKDIPLYPGLEIQMSSADPSGSAFVVQATTADAMDKVGSFYQKEMTAQGWEAGETFSGGGEMQMLGFEKGEMTAMIMLTADEGATAVSITTGI